MDGKKAFWTIVMVFAGLAALVSVLGSFFVGIYFLTIFLGALFQTTETGDLPVNNNTTNLLTTVEGYYHTIITKVLGAGSFGVSLLSIIILAVIFIGLGFGVYLGGKAVYDKVKGKGGGAF